MQFLHHRGQNRSGRSIA